MKCHYEILEISKEADESAIKTAYRKLALKWHPDKNLDNAEFAKEQFQLVQQAYEILSDRQERAWYDAHRDQILKGSNSDFQDKSLDVFQYFTTTCYKGFDDDESSFYSVYRKVFEQIAKEDIEFMDEKEDFIEIPGFGRSGSDYEETVKPFYDYWMSYSTKKSYSWLDPFDVREGRGDRRLLKIIEKENKKNRQKVRKERNEEVRSLVAFVRKRDKRVQTYLKEMEERTIENRKKQELISKQKRLERNKQHANVKQADWMKFDNVQSELEQIQRHLAEEFGEEMSNSEEEMDDNLYCIACNKVFKNPKAFENHESSRKHRENVDILRQSMLEEEGLDEDILEHSGDDFCASPSGKSELDVLSECSALGNEDLNQETSRTAFVQAQCASSDDEGVFVKKKCKKNKKNKNVLDTSEGKEEFDLTKVSDDDDFDFGTSKSQKKKNNRKANKKPTVSQDKAENGNEAPSKAKKERRKDKETVPDVSDLDVNHCCVTCKGNFPSKNKLFDHLKKTGHGVYIPPPKEKRQKKIEK